jgi:arsenite methyltransferase
MDIRENFMADNLVDTVRSKYGAVALSTLSTADEGVRAVAEAFGYSTEELNSIPAEANMGLSCGNPTAMASLRPGEVVVDLGSGGGLDVFLAAKKVGPTGKAIGIDMTPQMIERARANAAKGGFGNVEFHQASIDKLPLPDGSVDCIISNCVINLAADKPAVFREMFRVLKPGGRVAVSDIALKRELPEELARDVMAYVGCVAGAILLDDYVAGLRDAGFASVQVVDSHANLNAYSSVEGQSACCSPKMDEKSACCSQVPPVSPPASSCCSKEQPASVPATACCSTPAQPVKGTATVHQGLSDVLSRYNVNDYAASVKVYAVKPATAAKG